MAAATSTLRSTVSSMEQQARRWRHSTGTLPSGSTTTAAGMAAGVAPPACGAALAAGAGDKGLGQWQQEQPGGCWSN
jgi:hypothetical protein